MGVIALFYFILWRVALLNIIQFAKGDLDHPFHGLNPFPAFSSEYIGYDDLLVILLLLVASVFSVSDRFFDREKGFGFSTEAKKVFERLF